MFKINKIKPLLIIGLFFAANAAQAHPGATTYQGPALNQKVFGNYLYLDVPGASGWKVIADTTHPQWGLIYYEIYNLAGKNGLNTPALNSFDLTFYIENGKQVDGSSDPIASEYVNLPTRKKAIIIVYNPNSTTWASLERRFSSEQTALAASVDPNGQINDIERLLAHEQGHVLWGELSGEDREIWQEAYEITKLLDLDRPTQKYTKANGEVSEGSYYDEKGAVEGFCEAYADWQTDPDVPLDPIITTFLENMPKPD